MVRAAAGMVEALPAVTVVGVIVGIILVIVALVVLWYLVLFLLIKRGRRKRAERLAANPDAYPAAPTDQNWRGKES